MNYYLFLKHLFDGTPYTHDTAANLKRYFLERIYQEFGSEGLNTALKSFLGLIHYYGDDLHRNQDLNKKIYEEFKKKLLSQQEVKMDDELKKEICDDEMFSEGAVEQIIINKYSRSSKAREMCIEKYGTTCSVCGLKLEDLYGDRGKGFIHIHHIIPISTKKEASAIKCEDLRPVCPNCHAMLHVKPMMSIEELQKIFNEHRKK